MTATTTATYTNPPQRRGYTCPSCLGARHHACHIVVPAAWLTDEGSGDIPGGCVCACRRKADRSTALSRRRPRGGGLD